MTVKRLPRKALDDTVAALHARKRPLEDKIISMADREKIRAAMKQDQRQTLADKYPSLNPDR